MECFERVRLLADPEELDRLAGDVPHRQRRAAARVAVGLRQHDPRERQRGVERLGGMRRVLAGHAVHDEQRLDRGHRGVDPPDLLHHPLVDVEPARGIDEQHVGEAPPRLGERAGGDRDRVVPGRARDEADADLIGQGAELVDGGGTVHVAAHRHHRFARLLLEPARELRDGRRLARALEAGDQHHRRGRHVEGEPGAAPSHQRGQFVPDHPHQRLARGQARDHVLAHGARPHPFGELAHHRQRDVRFEQRRPDLAQRLLDVVLGEPAAATQPIQGRTEPAGQILEHRMSSRAIAARGL